MDTSYLCEQMNDILGDKMSELDYKLKYEIVYGFMPRPDYLEELKELYAFCDNFEEGAKKHKKYKWLIRHDVMPSIFKKKYVGFIINGVEFGRSKESYRDDAMTFKDFPKDERTAQAGKEWKYCAEIRNGNEEPYALPYAKETEEGIMFYNHYQLYCGKVSSSGFSRQMKRRSEKCGWGWIPKKRCALREIYMDCAEYNLKKITCKALKEAFEKAGEKPSKPIKKTNKREMLWEYHKLTNLQYDDRCDDPFMVNRLSWSNFRVENYNFGEVGYYDA